MRLLLTCTRLVIIFVGAAWPIVLVMSYSSEAEMEAKLKSSDEATDSAAWRLLRFIHYHRLTLVWVGLVLLLFGLLA